MGLENLHSLYLPLAGSACVADTSTQQPKILKGTPSILEILNKSREDAIETSIRSGVPLVYEEDGKIFEVPPKYKYIKVPIDTPELPLEEE